MKKNLLLILFILTFSSISNAQNTSEKVANKSVYAEFGGPGLFNINYDMRLHQIVDKFGFRAGIGYMSINENSFLSIPLLANYLIGNKNYFEVGAGATFFSGHSAISSNDDDNDVTRVWGTLNIGYRYQPINGGFQFRAGFAPTFGDFGFIPYIPYLSLGFAF